MTKVSAFALAATLASLTALACSSSESGRRLRVGKETDSEPGGAGVSGQGSGQAGENGIGEDDNALRTRITQPPSEMAIEVITIRCGGECKQVVATATGGNPPYAFEWSDGATTAARELCTDDDETFTVSVEDTAIETDEFAYEAHTASAEVTANVLDCGDAGTAADGGSGNCSVGFEPGTYDGSFKQAAGPLSGTHTLVLTKSAASATLETITGTLDNQLSGAATKAMVTFGEGSSFDCATQRLFLSGVRSEPGAIPLPYTYAATYDPTDRSLRGTWASAAPPSPGVFPPSALDTGSWDAHWVGP